MTQEEKELLRKDLAAKLPYGVMCHHAATVPFLGRVEAVGELEAVEVRRSRTLYTVNSRTCLDEDVKPLLRPMSSMTEAETEELKEATCPDGTGTFDREALLVPMNHFGDVIPYPFMDAVIQWLDARHFDHRGLLEKGLALEAPDGLYGFKPQSDPSSREEPGPLERSDGKADGA